MEKWEKIKFLSTGTVHIRGEAIEYSSVSEDFLLTDEVGEPEATMFMFSYERNNVESSERRPILFAYNGGPGACGIFVHLGMLGPERIKMGDAVSMLPTGPFEMENNDDCILDICDVVIIDAVGTGYAKLLKPEAKEKYFGSNQDANAFAKAISQWLTSHKRWNSPLYIMGESYGTIRNALLADALYYNEDKSGFGLNFIQLSGIIMLGTALEHGQKPFPIHSSVLNLPSIAATYWYHHQEEKPSLEEFVEEAYAFSYEKYHLALALGDRLPEKEQLEIAKQLNRFTGLEISKLLKDRLRVEIFDYPAEGMYKDGKTVGIYDGRFSLESVKSKDGYDFFTDDAANCTFVPAFVQCFNGIWKEKLSIELEQEYRVVNVAVGEEWNFKTVKAPTECLEKAMRRNPNLKVMFGTGYYDMLTTVGYARYLVSQFDFPKDRVWMKQYKAGHMPYLGTDSAKALGQDLRDFIRWGLE